LQALGELDDTVKDDEEAPGERAKGQGRVGKVKAHSLSAGETTVKGSRSKSEVPAHDASVSVGTGKGRVTGPGPRQEVTDDSGRHGENSWAAVEGGEEGESADGEPMTAKELLDAARDAADARSNHVMCDLLYNVSMLPEAEAAEAVRILRRRGYTRKMRSALSRLVAPGDTMLEDVSSLSQEVGLSGAIKWTASNGPLPDASDKSDQHAAYSLQEQDALKKLFNLTAVRLWMPAGVHQRVDLARDIESGIIFAELQDLQMIIALVRSYDSASLSQHTVEEDDPGPTCRLNMTKANQSFVNLIASTERASGGMLERLVHAYLAEARTRAMQNSSQGLARHMLRIVVSNIPSLQAQMQHSEAGQTAHLEVSEASEAGQNAYGPWGLKNTTRVLAMVADTLCYWLKEAHDIDEAGLLLERAMELDAEDADVRTAYAEYICRFRERPEEAMAMIRRALEKHACHQGLISAFTEVGRLDSLDITHKAVMTVIDNALAAATRPEDTVYALGLKARMMKIPQYEREELYERALALSPDHVQSLKGYGQVLMRRGSMYKAIEVLKRAYELLPADIQSASCLSYALIQTGRELDLAVPLLASVLSAGYQTATTLCAYAYCLQVGYGRTGDDKGQDVQRAADVYSKVLEVIPDEVFAIQQYALLLWHDLHKPEEAELLLRAALDEQPECAYVRTLLATLLHRHKKDFREAEYHFNEALEQGATFYATNPPVVFQRYCQFLLSGDQVCDENIQKAKVLGAKCSAKCSLCDCSLVLRIFTPVLHVGADN